MRSSIALSVTARWPSSSCARGTAMRSSSRSMPISSACEVIRSTGSSAWRASHQPPSAVAASAAGPGEQQQDEHAVAPSARRSPATRRRRRTWRRPAAATGARHGPEALAVRAQPTVRAALRRPASASARAPRGRDRRAATAGRRRSTQHAAVGVEHLRRGAAAGQHGLARRRGTPRSPSARSRRAIWAAPLAHVAVDAAWRSARSRSTRNAPSATMIAAEQQPRTRRSGGRGSAASLAPPA